MKIRKTICFLLCFVLLTSFCVPFASAGGATTPWIPMEPDGPKVPEQLGASIRLDTVQGIRFVGRIKVTGNITLTEGDDTNFGFLIAPSSAFETAANLTADMEEVAVVPAVNRLTMNEIINLGLSYNSDYVYFTAVLYNIPEAAYQTDILARAYLKTSETTYLYAENNIARSVYGIATAILADENASQTAKNFAAEVVS